MCAVISTNDGKKYQTPSLGSTVVAVVVGNMAGSTIKSAGNTVSMSCLRAMQDLNKGNDVVELRNAVNKALEISGAKAKGVELIDVKSGSSKFKLPFVFKFPMSDKSIGSVAADGAAKVGKSAIEDYNLKKAILTELPAKFRRTQLGKLYCSLIADTMKTGKNACYLSKANKCVVNLEKFGTSVFHEIGHSINYNQSKFWKLMQGVRQPAKIAAGIIPLVGLLKRKKVEGEEPKNIFDKVTTFIKDNCGKLTTLAFVPIVAEELKATARGNKLAKQILSPAMAKKVAKTNALGAATYILAGVFAGVGAFAASKLRDALTNPKEIKQKHA